MNRATTSLPVPDSPVSSTVVSVCATRAACASTSFHCARMADDAALAGARLELAGQRGDLRLEPRRRLARLGIAARRLGEPLVRQRQRQVVGDAPGEVDVVLAETRRVCARGRTASRRRPLPSGIGTRSAERTPRRANIRPRTLSGAISASTSWTT